MRINNLLSTSCLLIFLSIQTLSAQVWPGDVNNNGLVNHIDFLYWAQVYGETGPPRGEDEMGVDFSEKLIDAEWGMEFPDLPLDIVYADCDGNGVIDEEDYFAFLLNMGLNSGVITSDIFVDGLSGVDPQIEIGMIPPGIITEGSFLTFLLSLGTEDSPINDFNGIAFTMNFAPDVIAPNFAGFQPTWVPDDFTYSASYYQVDAGKIDVAFHRRDLGPLPEAFGPFGIVSLVIEDDVVGHNGSLETYFYIDNIRLVDSEFSSTPTAGDSITLNIFPNDIVASEDEIEPEETFELYPNPVVDQVQIQTNRNLERLTLWDALGQQIHDQTLSGKLHSFDMQHLPEGMYYLEVQTSSGIHNRKLVLHRR